jgi:hypothetical protein
MAPWVQQAGSSLYGNASSYAAANPYQGYTGATTAAANAPQNIATNQLTQNAQGPNQNTVNAANTVNSVAGAINPNASVQSLMNPYVSATLAPTLQNLGVAEGQTQQQTAANASMAGAYGGTGAGVQAAENANLYGQNVANATGAAYGNAYNAAQAQQNTNLATLLNAGSGQNAIGAGQVGASTAASGALGSIGGLQQTIGQQGLNLANNVNTQNQMGQLGQYATLAGMLQSTAPTGGTTTTGQSNAQATSPNNAGLGLLGSLLGSSSSSVGGSLLTGLFG